MRRFFIMLLLLVLPLQFSWAAMANYCGHETGAAAQHFGHHEHQHHVQNGKQNKGSAKSKFDGDCGFCKLSRAGVMSMSSLHIPRVTPKATHISIPAHHLASSQPSRPERPKWVRAA